MKKNFKRVLTLTLALLMLLTPMNVFAKRHQKRDIPLNGIIVNDHIVFSDVAPYIKKGRTFVPIRFIAEELGFDVKWDAKTRTATMTEGDSTVVVTIGSKTMLVNGEARELDLPAEITDGRTFVPLRAISEAFSKKVDYSADYRAVCIGDEVEYDKDYRVVYYYDKIDPVITEYEINIVTYKMTVKGEVKSFDTVEDLINVILDDFEQYKTTGKTSYGLKEYIMAVSDNVPEEKKLKDEYYVKRTGDILVGSWYGPDVAQDRSGNWHDVDYYTYIENLGGNKYRLKNRAILVSDRSSEIFMEQYGYFDPDTNILTVEDSYTVYGKTGFFAKNNNYAAGAKYYLDKKIMRLYWEKIGSKYYFDKY